MCEQYNIQALKLAGKTYTLTTDSKGYAYFKLTLKPGTYKAIASAGKASVTNTIKVKHIVSAKKVSKVKKSAARTVIKITVKGHKVNQNTKVKFKYTGKIKVKVKFTKMMKNQKVKVKFKGKTYSVKVNKKGVGYLKLTKKVAKKLKNFTRKLNSLLNSMVRNIKLKQIIKALLSLK